jgi:glyoxylase-like metal-dependent hydrolase (beta-lactamase superfamily II)
MGGRHVVHGVRQLPHPVSNAYLLDGGEGLVLIDVGFRGRALEIRREVDGFARSVGRDLAAIAVTHAHADHIGSLAARRNTCRSSWPEAPAIRRAVAMPTELTGLVGRIMAPVAGRGRCLWVDIETTATACRGPAAVALHTPGHTPGHTSFLWPEEGGVLFAGDVAVNVLGLRESFVHADRAQAMLSLQRVAALDFEVAVFGHGPPIMGRATARFRRLVRKAGR